MSIISVAPCCEDLPGWIALHGSGAMAAGWGKALRNGTIESRVGDPATLGQTRRCRRPRSDIALLILLHDGSFPECGDRAGGHLRKAFPIEAREDMRKLAMNNHCTISGDQ